jgi:hypothetical protein
MTPITVVSLSPFLRAAREMGLSDSDIEAIEELVAYAPEDGNLLEGTGGVRKRRIALPGRNKGKSGGGRLFTVFISNQSPAYIITIIDKSVSENLNKQERNELALLVQGLKVASRRRGHV